MNSNPSAAPIATAPLDTILEAPFYIPATGPASRPRRSLKSDDTFIVVDSYGDIGASAGGPDGLFHCDTRFLSRLELTINQLQPLLLGSNVRDDNTLLTVDLTNPDMFADGRLVLHKDTLHIVRTIFLWRGTAYQRLAVRNHGDRPVDLRLQIDFSSDFADLFEVRGIRRSRRGVLTPARVGTDQAVLSYQGLDGRIRRTTLSFDPPPTRAQPRPRPLRPRRLRRARRAAASWPSVATRRSQGRLPSIGRCARPIANGAPRLPA